MNSSEISHRQLIQAYDLGHIEEHSPGMIHWHPNGIKVLNKLKSYVRQLHENHQYLEVSSPIILSKSLWEQSGHWDKYQDGMFVIAEPKNEISYAVKPMSCPGQINIYNHQRRSYRELPLKLFEFGQVHRNEPSGALNGWLRLRGFTQDDSHIFLEQGQLLEVVLDFVKMVEEAYLKFGFDKWKWKLSLRPEKRAGSDAIWDKAEQQLRDVCHQLGLKVEEAPGEGAFYGPKLEAVLEDNLGRQWQCGVVQVDFVLPERFDLNFQNKEGKQEQPILVHHAVLGSLERWISIVLEHHGRLPEWLVPCPVAICPISKEQKEAALILQQKLKKKGILSKIVADDPISGRLRHLAQEKIPFCIILGKREIENQEISWRAHGINQEIMKEEAWLQWIEQQV